MNHMKKNESGGRAGPVLGVDPGTLTTGFGIVEERHGRLVCVSAGTIETKASDSLPQRLLKIGEGLRTLISKYRPASLVIEKTFVAKNVDSASKLGHARGVSMYEAAREGLDVFEYTPTEIKAGICGSGRAEKEQVSMMVRSLLGLKEVEKLDVTDALALAIHHVKLSQTRDQMQRSEITIR